MKINLDEDDIKTAIEAFLQKRTKGLDFKVEVYEVKTAEKETAFRFFIEAKEHKEKPDYDL